MLFERYDTLRLYISQTASMLKKVLKFLNQYHTKGRPVLLGFSGGPDSLALCHLLIEFGVDVHVAHVDHGWRAESGAEASYLRSYAKKLNIPFYTTCLQGVTTENGARDARLQFFSEIYQEGDFQALILGHHADDRVETTLKRMFEGAHLLTWEGIKEVSFMRGMCIWRPLIRVTKAEIRKWIVDKKLLPLTDKTNEDGRFLRARMRTQLFPMLEDVFGKCIASNLLKVAALSEDMRSYFDFALSRYFSLICRGEMGSYFTVVRSMHSVELKMFIWLWIVKEENRFLSHEAIDSIVQYALSLDANKEIMGVYIDRGTIFVPRPIRWETHAVSTGIRGVSSWKEVWQGEGHVSIADGDYEIIPYAEGMRYPGTHSIGKWWGTHKVPFFLRTLFPVVMQKGRIVGEFLSGRTLLEFEGPCTRISLTVFDKSRDKINCTVLP